MHSRTLVASLLLLATAASASVPAPAYTPPSYWRNIPPPLDDYRAVYREFKSTQSSHIPSHPDSARSLHPDSSIDTPISAPIEVHNSQADQHPLTDPQHQSQPQMASQEHQSQQQSISDILPLHRAINIFASLARSCNSLTPRLESPLQSHNTTVLAPLNSVMQGLARKPWEDPPAQTQRRAETGGEVEAARWSQDTAAANLDRFVLGHVVPVSPWREGKENAVATLAGSNTQSETGSGSGGKIWWETRGGGSDGSEERRVIMPGEIVVEGVVGRVGNGEVWALRGVIGFE